MSEYEKRLKYTSSNLGSGTADNSTYLRGDLSWQTVVAGGDVSAIESGVVMLAWDTYTDDRAFDDIAIDDFGDTTGIETGSSSGYTASSGYIQPTASQNMVLVSQGWEASANDPDSAFILLNIEPIDSITLDTDIKAYLSINDGTNYEQVTGLAVIREIGSYDFIRGDITGITSRTDKTIRIKIEGLNNGSNAKQFKLHAWAAGVRY